MAEMVGEGRRARWDARRAAGAALAILLVIVAGVSAAQEMRFFRIGTGTTGGTYFPIGGLLANAISNPPGSRPCERGGSCGVPGLIAVAQASSGSVENLQLMDSKELESALVQADIAYLASNARGSYAGRPPQRDLRAIANLYLETVHLVVRADSGIETVGDLEGKIVSIGEEGSGTLVEARLLLEAYGLSETGIDARHLRPGPAADRLAEGEIDAFFMVGGQPVAAIADLAERVPIRLVSLGDKVAEGLTERLPFVVATTIEEGVYRNVPAARTLGVGAQWLVRADVDPELVYGITRALWHPTTRKMLEAGHPRGRDIDVGHALSGLPVPLHPGAARYYEEVGMDVAAAEERAASRPAAATP